MNMESLDDDTFEEFKGGTLEIKQDVTVRLTCDTSSEAVGTSESKDNERNANLDNNKVTSIWSGSNISEIPKRITETLWSCRNNNNNDLNNSTTSAVSNINLEGATHISEDSAQDYFTFRDGIVEKAVQDCAASLVDREIDGELINTFLLTEITTWDAEKERLIILTTRSVISVKYDFIALKMLDHRRIDLTKLDSIVIGDLVYPAASLVPRLNGLASGVTNVMKGCLLERWSQQQKQQDSLNQQEHQQRFFDTTTNLFQPRDRKSQGVRLLWNTGNSTSITQRWNPFSSEVPYITYTSHPLQRHTESLNDNQKAIFSVDEFCRQVVDAVERIQILLAETSPDETNPNKICIVQHKDIVLQSYVGLGSLIYNRNALGFFKVRGKFSF